MSADATILFIFKGFMTVITISGNAREIMDIVEAFGWDKISKQDLETMLVALHQYVMLLNLKK